MLVLRRHIVEQMSLEKPTLTEVPHPPHRGKDEFLKYVDRSEFPKALTKVRTMSCIYTFHIADNRQAHGVKGISWVASRQGLNH